MKSIAVLSFSVVLGLALLQSCELFFGSTTTSTTTTTVGAVPITQENIVGVWVRSFSSPITVDSQLGTRVYTDTRTFDSDGTFLATTRYEDQVELNTAAPEYEGRLGAFAFEGSLWTLDTTSTYSGLGSPLTSTSPGWTLSSPSYYGRVSVLLGNAMYDGAWQLVGTNSGIVGTWQGFGRSDAVYRKTVWTFGADGTISETKYESDSLLFSTTAISNDTFDYSVSGNMLTLGPVTIEFLVAGNYLIIDPLPFIKQN